MSIHEFKLTKNKQRPDWCFSYEKRTADGRKYSMFTMNGGKTFLASIEDLDFNTQYRSVFSDHFRTVDECLEAFNQFQN